MVATTNMTRGTTAHVVRDQLLQDFMQGNFLPGMKLQMDELAERYAVSRTPIREALILLVQDGLLDSAGNYGFTMHVPTMEELEEMCDIRCALECLAVEKLITRGVPPELPQRLRENLAALREATDHKTLNQLDYEFHAMICDSCGAPLLSKTLRRNMLLDAIFNYMGSFLPERVATARRPVRAIVRRHGQIIDAIEAKDIKKARKAMFTHLAYAFSFYKLFADK